MMASSVTFGADSNGERNNNSNDIYIFGSQRCKQTCLLLWIRSSNYFLCCEDVAIAVAVTVIIMMTKEQRKKQIYYKTIIMLIMIDDDLSVVNTVI